MNKILKCLALLTVLGCSTRTRQEVLLTDISSKNEIFSNLVYDGKQLLMVGESNNGENSVLYKTILNNLNYWTFTNVDSLKGDNSIFSYSEENYYFVNRKKDFTNNTFSINKKSEKIKLLNSIDSTTIKFLHVNDRENFHIVIENKFENGSISSHGSKLTKYSDKRAVKSIPLNCNVLNPIFKNGFIYFKSSSNQIDRINVSNFERLTMNSNNIKIIDFQISDNDEYWVLGELNNKTILTEFKEGKWNIDKTFPIDDKKSTGYKLHYYKNFKAVLIYKVDENQLMNLGGTRYSLFKSDNDSKPWERIELPIDYYIKPNLFYKDEFFLAYSGRGKLTYIDFRNK